LWWLFWCGAVLLWWGFEDERGGPVSSDPIGTGIKWGTPVARGVLATTILGSGMAMLDGTVVNVALPRIGEELHASVSGLQWILDGYLLSLAALILVAGSRGAR
jgi:hypothetical protein